MARKQKKPPPAVPSGRPLRICFERIIPDELDTDQHVRRALREHMAAGTGKPLNAARMSHLSRMAVQVSKKWGSGAVLNCRFLDGSAKMKKQVEAAAHGWEKHADVKLKFIPSGAAEIRVSFFADNGSWSAVGRDALNTSYFPLHQPTMNYGWLRDDTDLEEYQRVVLHEFGHALGCVHEHQSPTFTRKWNVAAVMKEFSGPPNYWAPADIKFNVLNRYSPKGMKATAYDPKSIMLYTFDASLFADGGGPTNENSKLSKTDITHIKAMYP